MLERDATRIIQYQIFFVSKIENPTVNIVISKMSQSDSIFRKNKMTRRVYIYIYIEEQNESSKQCWTKNLSKFLADHLHPPRLSYSFDVGIRKTWLRITSYKIPNVVAIAISCSYNSKLVDRKCSILFALLLLFSSSKSGRALWDGKIDELRE